MAIQIFEGRAAAVAQASTVQVTAFDVTTTYKLTVGGQVVSVLGDTDEDTTASNLADAWNAATHAYFTGVTASVATDTVTLTADTAGVPFVAASSVTGGAGTIGAVTASTASSGPNDWSTAANWSQGTVPVNADTVVIGNSDVPILWGLDQSAVTLAELRVLQSYTGLIGLPADEFTTAADGSATSSTTAEYRDDYLQVGATLFNSGVPSGNGTESGSARIKVNFGSVQTTATVLNSASSPQDPDREVIRLKGTHASNTLNLTGGNIGTATEDAGEVSTWATINVSQPAGVISAVLNIGDGCTLTTINVGGGAILNLGANLTTLIMSGGVYTTYGSATHGTIDIRSGVCNYQSDGTVTTLKTAGAWDTNADPRAKTVTNCELYRGYTLAANTGSPLSVTFTNGIDLIRCGVPDGTLDLGEHFTASLSAV